MIIFPQQFWEMGNLNVFLVLLVFLEMVNLYVFLVLASCTPWWIHECLLVARSGGGRRRPVLPHPSTLQHRVNTPEGKIWPPASKQVSSKAFYKQDSILLFVSLVTRYKSSQKGSTFCCMLPHLFLCVAFWEGQISKKKSVTILEVWITTLYMYFLRTSKNSTNDHHS